MTRKRLKSYERDGARVQLDVDALKAGFHSWREASGFKVGEAEKALAKHLSVSQPTVHGWLAGSYGPADISLVEEAASLWGIDADGLLTAAATQKGGTAMNDKYTERQLEAIRRIYGTIMDFLSEFTESGGFNDYWFDLVHKEGIAPEHCEMALCELVDKKHRQIAYAVDRERFDLRGTPVYDALYEYIWNDLIELYDGKLSYAYRFEAPVECVDGTPGGVTTEEDYDKAIASLDALMDKYL